MKQLYLIPLFAMLWSCSESSSGPEENENSSMNGASSGDVSLSSGQDIGNSSTDPVANSSGNQVSSSAIEVSSSAVLYPTAPQAADWCAAAAENCGTVVDPRDNRSYKWTKIRGQTWMAENLKYTGAETGTRVGKCPGVTGADSAGDHANCETYGRLYTWYELNKTTYLANEDPQGLCPDGWEVASDDDWTNLVENLRYLNNLKWSDGIAYLLKATNTGNNSWDNAAYNAGNPYQFSAMPPQEGLYLFIWTADENAVVYGIGASMHAKSKETMGDMTHTKKEYGYARCIKSLF